MIIKVTQEDIDKGMPISASFCPVALACKRVFNKDCSVTRGTGLTVYMGEENYTWKRYKHLPYSVKSFINNFDHQFGVEPFEFELED